MRTKWCWIFIIWLQFRHLITAQSDGKHGDKPGFGSNYEIITRTFANCDTKLYPLDPEYKINGSLKVLKVSRTEEDWRGRYTLDKDIKVHGAKLSTEILVGSKYVPDYNFKTNKPCESLFFLPILKILLKADSSCTVKKGTYSIEKINPNKIVHAIFTSIQYSQYQVRFEINSKNGNLVCYDFTVDIRETAKKRKH